MDAEKIMRVMAFCLSLKTNALKNMDAWVLYTGDGWRLPIWMLHEWHKIFGKDGGNIPAPDIFVTGPDNGMLAEGKNLNARDFAIFLQKHNVTGRIFNHSTKQSLATHGQAKTLMQVVDDNYWKKVALFTSWYHAPRAFLTTLARMEGRDLLILPAPAYGLSFSDTNEEIENGASAWNLFNTNMLTRLHEYQEKGFCASWDTADAYLRKHGF